MSLCDYNYFRLVSALVSVLLKKNILGKKFQISESYSKRITIDAKNGPMSEHFYTKSFEEVKLYKWLRKEKSN